MKKRVILFGPLPPPYGGVSVFVSGLHAHLKDIPHQLWALHGSDDKNPGVIKIKHRRLEVISALRRHASGSRIVDFTHFHLEYPHKILLPIWLTAKLALQFEWVKYILDGSLPSRYPHFTPVQRHLFKSAINAADEFIVVSEELRDWLRNEIKVKQKITVIPCLLTIPDEILSQPLPPETKAKLAPFLQHAFRVCCIGTFIPSYGFAHVANAIERLREETANDIRLLLLDGTFAEEAGYREQVLAGRDWITVLQNVSNPEVYRVLRECNLFVRAFGSESYGISRVESIWCGVPVVATDVGEVRGMHVYHFGDEDRLAELIRKELFATDRGETLTELKRWSEQYRREAESNLQKFIDTVGLGA